MRSAAVLSLPLILCGCGIENNFAARRGMDVFEQVQQDEVDILFVVDDSFSMEVEQAALAAGFSSFIQELETANSAFQIGVVSTSMDSDDPNRGKLLGSPTFLTERDDYVPLFRDRVQVGINGSDKEKGLEAAAVALSPELLLTHNSGFLRPQANLLVIIISDEDDCSDAGALDGRSAADCYLLDEFLTPVSTLVDSIHDAKNNGELVQIGAIIGPFDDSCGEEAYPGRRYAEAVLQTGGLMARICQPDWSNVLYDLGLNAVGILSQFKLSSGADSSTIEVDVDGVPVLFDTINGWTYDAQHWVVSFHGSAIPQRGSIVSISYEITATGVAP